MFPLQTSKSRSSFSASPKPRIARQILLVSGTFVLLSTVVFLLWVDPAETVQATSAFVSVALDNLALGRARCASQCLADPFAKPGMLVYGAEASDTRWVPFPPQPELAQPLNSPDINLDEAIPEAALRLASPQYMRMLASSNGTEMDWARDKTVLFIGSSHDRNNIQFFCEELGGKYSSIGSHVAAACNVTSHNLVLALWFTFGVVDDESYDWFSKTELRPVTFERKIEDVMLPWMAKQGIGNPDLIIETSLFWDDSFFNQRSGHLDETAHINKALTYSELAWHRSRLRELVAYTRALYGTDIPIMFRTRHIRETNKWNRILRLFQLDQNLRAVAQELDVKLFTWGDMLEGVTSFYDGDQHFPRGPVTWLFGDMMLFYLKQAITPGCWGCENGQH